MSEKYPSVNVTQLIDCDGSSWQTKSGGILEVLYKLDYAMVMRFLDYDSEEFQRLPELRGLRSYRVSDITLGAVGAKEWHKARNEIVFALSGSLRWTCEDVYGGKKEYVLDGSNAVFTPRGILHTYTALSERASIGVLANTLFDASDPTTHDSYPVEEFRTIAEQHSP